MIKHSEAKLEEIKSGSTVTSNNSNLYKYLWE